jgi:hypothetical protein
MELAELEAVSLHELRSRWQVLEGTLAPNITIRTKDRGCAWILLRAVFVHRD